MNNIDWLVHRFEMRYPSFANDAVEYQTNGEVELLVRLKDGDILSYYEPEDLFCFLPDENEMLDEDKFRIEFGRRLGRIMRWRNVTQVSLSRMTSIPQPTISSYLNCDRTPNFYNLYKIARALDCSIDNFTYTWRKED